jgi:hypothetical protein
VIIACDRCTCGFIHRPDGWSDPCPFCKGLGGITFAELCRRLEENESTVIKLFKPLRAMRAKTAARILDKLLAL